MKLLVYSTLLFLFFSCSANKPVSTNSKKQSSTSNVLQKQFLFFENDDFSIKYPSSWKKIKTKSNYLNYTFTPNETINESITESNLERLECFKGMSKLELKKIKKKFGIGIVKTYVSIKQTPLNDTVTFKKIVANYLHSNKKNYRFVFSENKLLKDTEDYVIIANTTKSKYNSLYISKLQHIFQKENNVFIISYLSRDKNYSKYLNDFSTILSSFKTKETN